MRIRAILTLKRNDAMKSIANYHTHTRLCHHAEGEPVDFVRQAIKEGCTELGFSDHCPYPASCEDTWPEVRMSVDDIALYQDMVSRAREAAPFPVFMGFECEWDGRYASWYQDELKGRWGTQYLVLGSHWLTEGSSHIYCRNLESPAQLNRYIDQTIDGMRSGLFAFLAHPDLFMAGYREWDEQSKACLQAILDAAADLRLPIEVNGLGCSREPQDTSRGMRYQYPYVEFWEMVAEQPGLRVICNSDAHRPQDVIMNAWKARDFAGRFALHPLDKLDFD